jgi:hypothetical protein
LTDPNDRIASGDCGTIDWEGTHVTKYRASLVTALIGISLLLTACGTMN